MIVASDPMVQVSLGVPEELSMDFEFSSFSPATSSPRMTTLRQGKGTSLAARGDREEADA